MGRVTQLMRLYEASKFVDNNIIMELVNLANPQECVEEERVECIKAEALGLAIEANLVAKGLTAMVTVENETCQKIQEGADICLDGTSPGGGDVSGERGVYATSASDERSYSTSGSARADSQGALSILLALFVL